MRSERGSVTVVGNEARTKAIKGAESKAAKEQNSQSFLGKDRQLQTLVQAIPDIVFFKDVEGRNLIVNKAFERLVGLRQEEIIGKKDDELFPPDLAKQCRKSDKETLKKGKPLRFEEQMTDEKGQTWFFETIKSPSGTRTGKSLA